MASRRRPAGGSETRMPVHVLQEFVALFESRGWLDRKVRIRHNGVRYKIFCSSTEFLAYRINDEHARSPGVPGWPVCRVMPDHLFHDSEVCIFSSREPSIDDWLRCIATNDFEVIEEP